MAAVGLIGLAVLVLGEAQFAVQPAVGLKSVGTGGGRELSVDRESLMGRIKTAQIKVEQLQAIRSTSVVGATPDAPRQTVHTDVELAEAEAELATLRLQLARLDLQAAKTGSTPTSTVDLSTWGRADPQPVP